VAGMKILNKWEELGFSYYCCGIGILMIILMYKIREKIGGGVKNEN
jgi:hypothetical protein